MVDGFSCFGLCGRGNACREVLAIWDDRGDGIYRYEDDLEDTKQDRSTVVELDVLASPGQRYGMMMWCEGRGGIFKGDKREREGHRVVSAQNATRARGYLRASRPLLRTAYNIITIT